MSSQARPLRTLVRLSAPAVGHLVREAARSRVSRLTGKSGVLAEVPEFDPFAPVVVADPPAAFRALHAGPRVHRCRRRGIWILSRHEDVRAAARDHEALRSGEGVTVMRYALPFMLTMDRPQHERLRRVVTRHFTVEAVGRQREFARSLVDAAVERMIANGVSDFATELAVPLPVAVIARLLGVPQGDLPRFRRWSDEIVEGFVTMASPVWPPWLRKRARIAIAIRRLERYLQPLIAARRAAPTDDLLGRLLASSDDGRLSSEELFWFVLLLLVAGNETTTNLLSVLALALAEYPDQYELLRRGPDRIAAAVEEALRYSSPIQGFFRVAHSDYRVGDVTIPAGASVLLHFGAANRDPRRYAAPDDFAIDRDVSDQLAFGSGIHFCLGAHLARLEAAIVLEALIERVERVELAGEPVWLSNPTLRGLSRLPLRLLPA